MEWAGEVPPELIQVCGFGCDGSRGHYRDLLWNDDMLDDVVAQSYLIGFLGADWWGSDARATGAELRRLGHLLIERHYEDHFPTRWRHNVLRATRRLLRPLMEADYNRAVSELLQVEGMDFLLVFKGMLLRPETLRQFRERQIPTYCVYPDVSFRDHGRNIWDCLPLYDCVFTTKSFHLLDSSLKQHLRRLELVPHGFDQEVHRRITASPSMQSTYGCDVSFVGAWSPKKESLIAELIARLPEVDLRIWGPSWGHAADVVRKRWQGRGAWGDELAAIYGCSRINLGLLSEAGTGTRSGDLTTARTWQIPASGGFMLHEHSTELVESFIPNQEVGVFSGGEDLVRQVRIWLQDDAVRTAVMQRGHERAHRDRYTYARAVEAVLRVHREAGKQR